MSGRPAPKAAPLQTTTDGPGDEIDINDTVIRLCRRILAAPRCACGNIAQPVVAAGRVCADCP
ncbi:hypothetical protein [Micromonospora sp. WMMD1082]|uniref:hypothetical protein n=1 Tax=Micromonospora sp. WMMD1082 TaxID=3016104 RepID=UPI0024171855|nr:hypothetical protein [Micromonospora sp. WMMD1082]MDG4795095.1 hypothetical protein [Micromonospora sp. WMMD1082]